ncbi:MAG: PEP-CTERM sorting domain-containing protein [Fimbriimonadales bacterium]|nr:PEP-CTERM sorting domain-containing protein [Fimbriimonadales bacterium]
MEFGFRNDTIRPTYFGYVDDVQLEAAIPEPATGVALGVLAAVALLRRRGRQS